MHYDWEDRESKPDRPLNHRYPIAYTGETATKQFNSYLEGRLLDPQLARKSGWYLSRSANARYIHDGVDRIVIPAVSRIDMVYWQARDTTGTDPGRFTAPASPSRDAVLVAWPYRLSEPILSVVCEGPMDALAAAGAGRMGVALMGDNYRMEALVLTTKLIRGTMCTIVSDSDSIPEMTKIMTFLALERCNVRLLEPYPYKDLAEAPPEERERILA